MAQRVRFISSFTFALVALAAHACSTPVDKGDSESHFLEDCVATCASGLSCLCGVCTKTCSQTSECSSLGARAECATPLEQACAAHGNVCDVACLTDASCASLGSGFGCVSGRCRQGPPRAPDAGSEGGGGPAFECGNGICEPGETPTSCSKDCFSGLSDSGTCNYNGVCDANETEATCSNDCYCNFNGTCDPSENASTCAADCAPACNLKRPPAPPTSDAGFGPDGEIVAVMYSADLGDSAPNPVNPPTHYRDIGFDLDGICTMTTSQSNQECKIPSYGFGVVDGTNGIDNAFGQIVQLVRNQLKNFSSAIYTTQLQQGAGGLILHVTGYDGAADDSQVTVALLSTAPFDSPPLTKGTMPKWDGTDEWPIASDIVINADLNKPKFVDHSAYVTQSKLVVRLPTASMRWTLGLTAAIAVNLELAFRGATLVCDVTPTNVGTWGYKLQNCTLGARILVNDLVHQLSHFPDPATNLPLCLDSNLYLTFKDNICGLVDVNSEALATPDDCMAISFGMMFDTEPGNIGNVYQVSPLQDLCPPGTQPSSDNCGTEPDAAASTGTGGSGNLGGRDAGRD